MLRQSFPSISAYLVGCQTRNTAPKQVESFDDPTWASMKSDARATTVVVFTAIYYRAFGLIAGVALSLTPKLGAAHPGHWWGELAVLASAGVGALCSVLYRPYLQRYPTLPVSALAMGASVLFLAPMALLEDWPAPSHTTSKEKSSETRSRPESATAGREIPSIVNERASIRALILSSDRPRCR